MDKIFNFIEQARKEGVSCLVHSKWGRTRAICAVCAYLMKKYFWSAKKTLEFLIARRPDLKLSRSCVREILSLEQRLRKQNDGPLSTSWEANTLSEPACDGGKPSDWEKFGRQATSSFSERESESFADGPMSSSSDDEVLVRNTFCNSLQLPPHLRFAEDEEDEMITSDHESQTEDSELESREAMYSECQGSVSSQKRRKFRVNKGGEKVHPISVDNKQKPKKSLTWGENIMLEDSHTHAQKISAVPHDHNASVTIKDAPFHHTISKEATFVPVKTLDLIGEIEFKAQVEPHIKSHAPQKKRAKEKSKNKTRGRSTDGFSPPSVGSSSAPGSMDQPGPGSSEQTSASLEPMLIRDSDGTTHDLRSRLAHRRRLPSRSPVTQLRGARSSEIPQTTKLSAAIVSSTKPILLAGTLPGGPTHSAEPIATGMGRTKIAQNRNAASHAQTQVNLHIIPERVQPLPSHMKAEEMLSQATRFTHSHPTEAFQTKSVHAQMVEPQPSYELPLRPGHPGLVHEGYGMASQGSRENMLRGRHAYREPESPTMSDPVCISNSSAAQNYWKRHILCSAPQHDTARPHQLPGHLPSYSTHAHVFPTHTPSPSYAAPP